MQKPPASAAFVRAPPAGILTGRGGGGGGGGRGPGGQEAAGTGGRQPGPHRARHGLLLPQLLRVLRGSHGGELRVQPLQPGGLLPVQPHAGGLRACARLRPPRLRQLRPGRPPRPPALALLGSSLQILLGPVWDQREAEAAADPHDVHQLAAEGAGAGLCRDSLPRHLHPRGAGAQDRPHRGAGAGVVPEPSSQIPQAGARRQRQGCQRHRQQREEVGAPLLLRRRRIQGVQLQPDPRQHGLAACRRSRQSRRQPEPQPRRGGAPGTRPCPPAPQGAALGGGGGRQRSPQHGRAAEGLAAHRGCAGTLLRRPLLLPSETERHQDKPLLIAEPPDPPAPRTPSAPALPPAPTAPSTEPPRRSSERGQGAGPALPLPDPA